MPSGIVDVGRSLPNTSLLAVSVAYSSPTLFAFRSTLAALSTWPLIVGRALASTQSNGTTVARTQSTWTLLLMSALLGITGDLSSTAKSTVCGFHQLSLVKLR